MLKDRISSDKSKTTEQGYIISQSKLAKIGVMQYLGSEIQNSITDRDIDKDRVYNIQITDGELFNDKVVKSFESLPVTLFHPNEEVNASNWKNLAIGHVQNVRRDGNYLVGDVVLCDESVIKEIKEKGIKEISLGYECEVVKSNSSGVDFEKKGVVGNHIAIVPMGRAGSECRINDNKPNKIEMDKRNILLDRILKAFSKLGIHFKDEEGVTEEDLELKIQELISSLEELKAATGEGDEDEKEAKILELKSQIAELSKQLEEMKGKTAVADEDGDSDKEGLEELKEENKTLKEQVKTLLSELENIKKQAEDVIEEEEKESVLNDAKNLGVKILDAKSSSTFIKKQILLDSGIDSKDLQTSQSVKDNYNLFKMMRKTSERKFKVKDSGMETSRVAPVSILGSKKNK